MKRTRCGQTQCAICRKALSARCGECESSQEDRACQGTDHNAACFHTFHFECIEQWLRRRWCCPLCNATWIKPHGLTLKQLAVAPWIETEMKIVELVSQDLDTTIYATLDYGLRMYPGNDRRLYLPKQKQRLLAHAFGQYLEIGELERLLTAKKNNKGA